MAMSAGVTSRNQVNRSWQPISDQIPVAITAARSIAWTFVLGVKPYYYSLRDQQFTFFRRRSTRKAATLEANSITDEGSGTAGGGPDSGDPNPAIRNTSSSWPGWP